MTGMRLLPPNSTPLEQALAASMARIGDIELRLDTLCNPDTCPVEFLPWLSWAVSVDEWNDDWPEETRRRVIREAPAVHAIKGTPAGVERALIAQGLDARLLEWFEYGGTAYRFKVAVTLFNRGLTQSEYASILRTVLATKNTRSRLDSLDIALGARGESPVAGAVTAIGNGITVYPYQVNTVTQQSDVPVVSAVHHTSQSLTVLPYSE